LPLFLPCGRNAIKVKSLAQWGFCYCGLCLLFNGRDRSGREGDSGSIKANNASHPTPFRLRLRVVKDFLPSPEQLAFKEEKVKITISLSRASLDFFKEQAGIHQTSYQKMIRNLLDTYAVQHTK
jgi:hypothetical protein